MSGAILTTDDRFTLAEARAVCDGCKTMGPPVECRMLRRKGDVDAFALGLAREVSGFLMTWAYQPRSGRRRGGQVEHLLCRVCAKKRYVEVVCEHGRALEETGGRFGRVMALQASHDHQARVAEMMRLRAYLGIPEVGAPAREASGSR